MSKIKTFGSHLVDFSIIPEGGIFIDAGACQGNFIEDVKSHAVEPFIIAIEPNRQNYRDLIEKDYDGVCLLNVALHETDSYKVDFNDFNEIGLHEWGNVNGLYNGRRHQTYQVEAIGLQEVLNIAPELPIHHLKMDIEGSEHGIVASMTQRMADNILQISMEVHSGLQQMEGQLKKLGYRTQFEKGELYAVRKEL